MAGILQSFGRVLPGSTSLRLGAFPSSSLVSSLATTSTFDPSLSCSSSCHPSPIFSTTQIRTISNQRFKYHPSARMYLPQPRKLEFKEVPTMTPEITLKYLDEQIALIGTDAAPETIKDTTLMTAEVIEEQRLLDELAKTLPQAPNVLYEPLRKKGQRRVNHYYYRPAPNSPDYKWLVGGPEVLEEVQKNSKPYDVIALNNRFRKRNKQPRIQDRKE